MLVFFARHYNTGASRLQLLCTQPPHAHIQLLNQCVVGAIYARGYKRGPLASEPPHLVCSNTANFLTLLCRQTLLTCSCPSLHSCGRVPCHWRRRWRNRCCKVSGGPVPTASLGAGLCSLLCWRPDASLSKPRQGRARGGTRVLSLHQYSDQVDHLHPGTAVTVMGFRCCRPIAQA